MKLNVSILVLILLLFFLLVVWPCFVFSLFAFLFLTAALYREGGQRGHRCRGHRHGHPRLVYRCDEELHDGKLGRGLKALSFCRSYFACLSDFSVDSWSHGGRGRSIVATGASADGSFDF